MYLTQTYPVFILSLIVLFTNRTFDLIDPSMYVQIGPGFSSESGRSCCKVADPRCPLNPK